MRQSQAIVLFAALMAVAFAGPAFAKKKTDVVTTVLRAFHIASRADRNARAALAPVNSKRIADGAVQTADLASGAVTGAKLAANSVSAVNVIDGTIGPPDLVDGGVTSSKLRWPRARSRARSWPSAP
jgi:hypothetical protein